MRGELVQVLESIIRSGNKCCNSHYDDRPFSYTVEGIVMRKAEKIVALAKVKELEESHE